MREIADVIVIGGGSTGCSIACHLAERGIAVRVYEAGRVGGGTTGDSPGVIRSFYNDAVLTALAWQCIHLLRQWDKASDGACGYTPCGFLTGIPKELSPIAAAIVESSNVITQPLALMFKA